MKRRDALRLLWAAPLGLLAPRLPKQPGVPPMERWMHQVVRNLSLFGSHPPPQIGIDVASRAAPLVIRTSLPRIAWRSLRTDDVLTPFVSEGKRREFQGKSEADPEGREKVKGIASPPLTGG